MNLEKDLNQVPYFKIHYYGNYNITNRSFSLFLF